MDKNKFNFLITNFVTFIRVAGIFALIPVYKLYGGFALFLLSSSCFLSDCIDGIMARKLKCSTFFGSLFDSISDKAFLIINMILLMSITPLAIIPVFLELGIAVTQTIKYNMNMNVQSNIFGKLKMWVAGLSISLTYLLVDEKILNYLGSSLLKKINNMNHIHLFSLILAPLVISEFITLTSYVKEYYDYKKELTPELIKKHQKEEEKIVKEMQNTSVKDLFFKHEYYEKYKDYGNLKLIRTLAKKK